MRLQYKTVFRACGVGLIALTFWAIWASAQPDSSNLPVAAGSATNSPALTATNASVDATKPFSGLDQDYVTIGLNRIHVLDETKLFGQPLWKYIASLIYIFLAFYVSKFLDFLTRVWLKRWADRTATKFDDLVLDLLNGPVKVVSFVILLHIGLSVFHWPPLIEKVLSKGLIVVVAATLTYLVLKLVDLLLGYWRLRAATDTDRTFDEQLFPIVRKSLKLFVIVVAVLVTSDNMGVNITAAVASLSIGGLALGLAAQDTLANLFGAVAVFLDKPFRLGDRIKLEGVDGTVETIGLRSTRVRNPDGHFITVPNKTMGNAIITNIASRPNIRTEMNIGVTYDTPVAKVRRATAILEEVMRGHPQTVELLISFNRFGESALNILVVHVWKDTDMKLYLAGMQELNLAIKERFDQERIEFAFPTQTIYTKQGDEGKTPVPSTKPQ